MTRVESIADEPTFGSELQIVTGIAQSSGLVHYLKPRQIFNIQVTKSRMERAKLGAMVKELRKPCPQFLFVCGFWLNNVTNAQGLHCGSLKSFCGRLGFSQEKNILLTLLLCEVQAARP